MSTDLETLLARAADDTAQPLQHSVDDIVRRGRRGQHLRRTAVVAASALSAGAIISGLTVGIGALNDTGAQPAGSPGTTATVIPERLKPVQPPASTLTSAQSVARCRPQDEAFRYAYCQDNTAAGELRGAGWFDLRRDCRREILSVEGESPDQPGAREAHLGSVLRRARA